MPFDGEFFDPGSGWPAGPGAPASKRLDRGEAVRLVAALIATIVMALGPFALLALHVGSPLVHR
jgi:hypothetical protein